MAEDEQPRDNLGLGLAVAAGGLGFLGLALLMTRGGSPSPSPSPQPSPFPSPQPQPSPSPQPWPSPQPSPQPQPSPSPSPGCIPLQLNAVGPGQVCGCGACTHGATEVCPAYGETCVFTAYPDGGANFSQWQGPNGVASTDNPVSLPVYAPGFVSGVFQGLTGQQPFGDCPPRPGDTPLGFGFYWRPLGSGAWGEINGQLVGPCS